MCIQTFSWDDNFPVYDSLQSKSSKCNIIESVILRNLFLIFDTVQACVSFKGGQYSLLWFKGSAIYDLLAILVVEFVVVMT